jgi:hypothetical protein
MISYEFHIQFANCLINKSYIKSTYSLEILEDKCFYDVMQLIVVNYKLKKR